MNTIRLTIKIILYILSLPFDIFFFPPLIIMYLDAFFEINTNPIILIFACFVSEFLWIYFMGKLLF
jgi:hypothetical protein